MSLTQHAAAFLELGEMYDIQELKDSAEVELLRLLDKDNMVEFLSIAQCVLCSVRCPCFFYDPVSDTLRRRGGYRGIFKEEGVDTVTYFRGKLGVKKSPNKL